MARAPPPPIPAEVPSPHGRAILRVPVTDRLALGHPFAPMHWTGETAPSGGVDMLAPGLNDPISGQPALTSAPVAMRPFAVAWCGFAMAPKAIAPDCEYGASRVTRWSCVIRKRASSAWVLSSGAAL